MNPALAARAAQLRAHRRTRELAHYEAAARTSTHEDVREIARLWREIGPQRNTWVIPPPLERALDALVEGWRQ